MQLNILFLAFLASVNAAAIKDQPDIIAISTDAETSYGNLVERHEQETFFDRYKDLPKHVIQDIVSSKKTGIVDKYHDITEKIMTDVNTVTNKIGKEAGYSSDGGYHTAGNMWSIAQNVDNTLERVVRYAGDTAAPATFGIGKLVTDNVMGPVVMSVHHTIDSMVSVMIGDSIDTVTKTLIASTTTRAKKVSVIMVKKYNCNTSTLDSSIEKCRARLRQIDPKISFDDSEVEQLTRALEQNRDVTVTSVIKNN